MNFTELGLDDNLLKGITEAGYETCTPVQEQVLSGAFEGTDLYVQSQTGTGKTAAYLITIFQQVLKHPDTKEKKALIMVPTRELAVQVEDEAKILGKYTNLRCGSFYGGVGYEKQQKILEKGIDIIIGTPGRVIDLQENGKMNLSEVGFLVIDEADRMFDMGFYPDLRTLIKVLPDIKNRQTMLFSATLNTYVKNLAWEYTEDAKEITIECEHITVSEIDQILLHVSSDDKMKLLLGVMQNEKPENAIIFCNTKRTSEIIAKRLKINNIEAEYIIGDLPQTKRLQIINSFKKGNLKYLVATDVAARGIDVDNLSMVINYDLPNEAENYVHRIGRTARAGKSGKAYTFCSEQDVYNLPAIERYIEMNIPASMAAPEQMLEDKSTGIYIKLSKYGEDDNFENHKKNKHHSSNKKYGEHRTTNNNNKKTPRKNTTTQKDKPRNARGSKIEEDLSTLSFDERMKLYKEKYGGSNISKKETSKKRNTYKKQNKKTQKSNIQQKNTKNNALMQNKQTPVQKKNFLSKLLSIFKK